MNERSPLTLYIWANVDSMKAEAEPISAISHIQNIAPGPPKARAVATPARLPVPTREAVANAKCLKRRNRVFVVPACYSVTK